jgi:hypothetical protein
VTILMTWPLVLSLGRDIPWDLGDSVLNLWILQWGADHTLRFLGGDLRAFAGFFNANIFYPEPLTLAYSEHLAALVAQILPVYALTGNIVLAYNLLFLSTFVLSGLGTYLLVRELTGSAWAGLVAGLLYAFAPYRIGQYSHLQVISSQWMPFALFGLRRYFDRRSSWALAGAALALVAQNLSCGYYVLFFSPVVAAYVLYEIADRSAWRDARLWGALTVAGTGVAAITVPFLLPYMELRAHGFGPRPFGEVLRYSADVYSYLVAHGAQRFWGELVRAYPKPEGDLFPSVTPVLLALVGAIAHARQTWHATAPAVGASAAHGAESNARDTRTARDAMGRSRRWRQFGIAAASVLLASQLAAVVIILARNGIDLRLGPWDLRLHNLARSLRLAAVACAALAILSPRVRAWLRGVPRSAVAFYVAALLVAFWLSLGPILYTQGQRIAGDGPYWWLYLHVPGFDGLRVPARFGMLVALFLAVLGGYGVAAIESAWPKRGTAVALAAGLFFLVESNSVPLELNGTWKVAGTVPPPVPILAAAGPPAIYRAVAALPRGAALVEFPFGEEQFDLRYMLWSASHHRALVNGYSGGFPPSYAVNRAALGRVPDDGDRGWEVLRRTGATHAVVHEGIYLGDRGARVSDWLLAHGARPVATFGSDRLFEIGQ